MAAKQTLKQEHAGDEPRPPRRIARRRQRRIAAILAEAATELAEEGYWAFSLEAVADRLDLAKTTLYHYFASKDALVAAALEDLAARVIHRLEVVANEPGREHRDRLRALIVAQLTLLLQDNPEATGLFARPRDWPDVHRELVKTLTRKHDRVFRAVVQEGVRAGEFHPISVRTALQCMHGAVNGVAAGYHAPRNGVAVTNYIGEVADTILAMFVVPQWSSSAT